MVSVPASFSLCRGGSSITVLTVYTLCKCERQFSEMMSSNQDLNRGRYIRLMALPDIEILGAIPIGHRWSKTPDQKLYSHRFRPLFGDTRSRSPCLPLLLCHREKCTLVILLAEPNSVTNMAVAFR
jgi:hypothetical protein